MHGCSNHVVYTCISVSKLTENFICNIKFNTCNITNMLLFWMVWIFYIVFILIKPKYLLTDISQEAPHNAFPSVA